MSDVLTLLACALLAGAAFGLANGFVSAFGRDVFAWLKAQYPACSSCGRRVHPEWTSAWTCCPMHSLMVVAAEQALVISRRQPYQPPLRPHCPRCGT